MTDSSSSLMQYGFPQGDENYQNEATTTTESKRTREFFESENDMDVDIVRNEDSLGKERVVLDHDVYVYSDGKRLRRMWENGNIDLLFNSGSSSTSMLPSPERWLWFEEEDQLLTRLFMKILGTWSRGRSWT